MDKVQYSTELRQKLHRETAKIAWNELQRFFAQGSVLLVSDELNLVEVAGYFAEDRQDLIAPLLSNEQIAPPSNDQARRWFKAKIHLWSVVVAPFVLVQAKRSN